jgi:hypothetical protein
MASGVSFISFDGMGFEELYANFVIAITEIIRLAYELHGYMSYVDG